MKRKEGKLPITIGGLEIDGVGKRTANLSLWARRETRKRRGNLGELP